MRKKEITDYESYYSFLQMINEKQQTLKTLEKGEKEG